MEFEFHNNNNYGVLIVIGDTILVGRDGHTDLLIEFADKKGISTEQLEAMELDIVANYGAILTGEFVDKDRTQLAINDLDTMAKDISFKVLKEYCKREKITLFSQANDGYLYKVVEMKTY